MGSHPKGHKEKIEKRLAFLRRVCYYKEAVQNE